ncbi:globin [Natronospira bacteriovora]|uniref:Globin n=1 Tax=Natronospira bacteriovora TaxID=3069753 RepID=A0ABU0W7K9_9GAMM|nr:globin [Natronospira sp. AB-CW4]MDQ2070014.1 globin [Natronospira sp. AB-CW4]
MDQFADVQQSFGRCLRGNNRFVDDFYRRLLGSDERIATMFASTDWTLQNKAIRRGISLAITFAGTPVAARRQVREMAEVHSRGGRAPITPELYEHWIESLILTVQASDPDYSPSLGKRWRTALEPAIGFMQNSY